MTSWLNLQRGEAPLVVTFPHTGTDLADRTSVFHSEWIARRDADWWVDQLYGFAADLGATTIRTDISRSVIDVNRDPSGASLYPGHPTTELCPTTTFDGDPLYRDTEPDDDEIARLRAKHSRVVLYDAHSIRSHVPRLFEGELPQFNIGTNDGRTCDPALASTIEAICAASVQSHALDGRFKGGWTTRHYGCPANGVHAIQMELAMRGYLNEPAIPDETNWPVPFDPTSTATLTPILRNILTACIAFAAI